MGRGEALFAGLDLDALGYECTGMQPGERAVHMRLRKRTTETTARLYFELRATA